MSDDEATYRGWDAIVSTLQVSSLLGSILYMLFEAGRQLNNGRTSAYGGNYVSFLKLPYGNDRKVPRYVDVDPDTGAGTGPDLPERPSFLGGWLQPVIQVDGEQQLLDLVGLDAFVLLRFLRMQCRIFSFVAFWGVVVLIPLYDSGAKNVDDTFYQTTMANMAQGSKNLWVVTLCAYFFTLYALYLLSEEYRDFVQLRHQFFVHGSRETAPQARYTVLVEMIPPHLRTNAALYKYFNELFPGQVHSAIVCLNTRKLAAIMRRREQVASLLEKYTLLDNADPDGAPHRFKPWGFFGSRNTDQQQEVIYAASASLKVLAKKETNREWAVRWLRILGCCESSAPQPAVEFLGALLELLNDEVIAIQKKYSDDAHRAEIVAAAEMPLLSSLLFSMEENIGTIIDVPRGALEGARQPGFEMDGDRRGQQPAQPAPPAPPAPPGQPAQPESAGTLGEESKDNDLARTPSLESYPDDVESSRLSVRFSGRFSESGISSKRASVPRPPKLKLKRRASLVRRIVDAASAMSPQHGGVGGERGSLSLVASGSGSSSTLKNKLLDEDYTGDATSPQTPPPESNLDYGTMQPPSQQGSDEEQKPEPGTANFVTSILAGMGKTAVDGTTAVGRTGVSQILDNTKIAVGGAIGGLGNAIATLEALTIGSDASNTGFVTFTSLAATASAHQCLLTNAEVKGTKMTAVQAPEPRDIVWKNVANTLDEARSRRLLAMLAFATLALLFNVPIGLCVAATNRDTLIRAFPSLEEYQDEQWFQLLSTYLPTLAALGIVQLTPLIFLVSAEFYERYKTMVMIQTVILRRFFNVQLAFVYITVTAGSVTDAIFDIIEDPSKILSILGNALPAQGSYFMGVMIIRILQGLTWELSRLHVIFPYLVCGNKEKKLMGEREILDRTDPRAFPYGWVYPAVLMSTIIGFCFQLICPLISIAVMIYFFLAYIIYKHQLIYVYINSSESGGAFFFPAFSRTITAMLAGQLTLAGYMVIKEGFGQASFVLVLPGITIFAAYMLHEKYERPAKTLAFERAAYVDRILSGGGPMAQVSGDAEAPPTWTETGRTSMSGEEVDSEASEFYDWRHTFTEKAYQQPELRSTERVEPMPSRWMQ